MGKIVNFRGLGGQKKGKDVSIYGRSKVGKSTLLRSLPFFCSKYIDEFPDDCGYAKKLLENPNVPEIRKIKIIDTDDSYSRVDLQGTDGLMMDGLELAGEPEESAVEFATLKFKIPDKTMDPAKGKESCDELVEKFMNDLENIVKETDRNTAIAVDSASDYAKLLNARLEFFVREIDETKEKKGNVTFEQSYWQYRNRWWNDFLMTLRGFNGWTFYSFNMKKTPEWMIEYAEKKGKAVPPRFVPDWPTRTSHKFDQVFSISKAFNYTKDIMTRVIKVRQIGSKYYSENDNKVVVEDEDKFIGVRLLNYIARGIYRDLITEEELKESTKTTEGW